MSYSKIIDELKSIQNEFSTKYGVNDIYSNSKIYEIIIADLLGHELIPGHAGSRDAKLGNQEYEYKHFKESSSNHSWTFNDYSESTISKMNDQSLDLVFAHVNDKEFPPQVDWFYQVNGPTMSSYMSNYTKQIKNSRKMINVSANQIETRMGILRKSFQESQGRYAHELKRIFSTIRKLEIMTKVDNILTSNKFWEVVVANELGHQVNSEQGGRAGAHDASDGHGNWFEYKVVVTNTWNFQDISETVLEKYYETKSVICASVNKQELTVTEILSISPQALVPELRRQLKIKAERAAANRKEVRRVAVSLGRTALIKLGAVKI
jgi:hypothetical protein